MNRLVLLATGLAATLTLTGCAQSGEVAARVGDDTVSTSDVDFLTEMQCASLDSAADDPAQVQAPSQEVATSQVRTSMVNTLVQAELDHQLAEQEDVSYDRATLRTVMQQFESVLETVPAADRDRFRAMVEDIYRGQLEVYAMAQRDLGAAGLQNPTQEQVDAAISAIQTEFRQDVDIELNPVYGADGSGVAGAVDPSLSLPVSSFAKDARSAQPDPEWVAQLPADQRCG